MNFFDAVAMKTIQEQYHSVCEHTEFYSMADLDTQPTIYVPDASKCLLPYDLDMPTDTTATWLVKLVLYINTNYSRLNLGRFLVLRNVDNGFCSKISLVNLCSLSF